MDEEIRGSAESPIPQHDEALSGGAGGLRWQRRRALMWGIVGGVALVGGASAFGFAAIGGSPALASTSAATSNAPTPGGSGVGGRFSGSTGSSGTTSGSTNGSGPAARTAGGKGGFGGGARFGGFAGPAGYTITAVGDSTIMVKGPAGRTLTIDTTTSTVYRAGALDVSRTDLAVGETIALAPQGTPGGRGGRSTPPGSVEPQSTPPCTPSTGWPNAPTTTGPSTPRTMPRCTPSTTVPNTPPTTITASTVTIVGPSVEGTVESVSGSTIVVTDSQGFWRTVNTDSNTVFGTGSTAGSSTAVKVGDRVEAVGTIASDHTTLDALAVDVVPAQATRPPAVPGGLPAPGPGSGSGSSTGSGSGSSSSSGSANS